MARRPRPSLRALLFGCGGGAVLGQRASFLVGSESNVRQWGPWPAGPVRPSGPCCLAVAEAPLFGVAEAPFVRLGGWKTGQTASFLVGSESNVRQWGPWPAGPVRPSGPCCFGVASAVACRPGPSLRALLFRCGERGGLQARSVLQGPAVWLWRRRRFRSDSYFSCRFRKQR